MLGTIIKNKILVYLVSRYGTYALQFIISMVIAARLGPYYMGIYGFVYLIIGYFGQINFGIPHSLNVLLVHNKNNKSLSGDYIFNALWLYSMLSGIILLAYLSVRLFGIKLNNDYSIDEYLPFIIAIAILTYFNSIFTTVLRVRNKVNQLSVIQSLNVVLNLCVVFVLSGEDLILALLLCNFLTCLISAVITFKADVLPRLGYNRISIGLQKGIIHKGLFLFLYNSCFYFILISIRTIISDNYSVEEFGAFTFSFTIANAVMLLLESLLTIIFPKVIDLLSSDNYEQIESILEKMRLGYVSSSHFLIYIAMLFFPLLVFLMPKYDNALTSMNLIALAVLMNTINCGYSSLLIAQNKEKIAAYISFLSLIINIVLGLILVDLFKVEFSYVIIAALLTYLVFSFLCVWKGRTIIGNPTLIGTIKDFFPIRLLIPYLCAFIISVLKSEYIIWLPLVLYLFLNWHDIQIMKNMALKIVKNPNIADI